MKVTSLLSLLPFLGVLASTHAQEPAATQEPLVSVAGHDFYDWQEYVNSDVFQALGLRCGTEDINELILNSPQFRAPSDCSLSNTTILPQNEPANGIVYQIPVVFHVIHRTGGLGNLGLSRIESQIRILNEDFRAIAGTNGAPGKDARIQFYLATEDPFGNPTDGITRTANNTWFNDSGNYRSALHWDTNRYLNIYSTNPGGGVLGYASIPQAGGVGSSGDGITVLYSAVGANAILGPPYNQGRTLTHEVGHYLGLLHTFQGGCASGSCSNNGDLICDTNRESGPRFGCPNATSCNSPDPVTNYMDYTDDLCMNNFTPNQANRMRCTIDEWRPNLARPICNSVASATVRNGGTNPNVLTANPPVMGEMQEFAVATAPYDFASIVGYQGMGNTLLSGGQTVLVDLGSTKLFQIGLLAGPNAMFSVLIPIDVNLCNLPYTTQAVLFGGATPYALSNAVDHVIGDN